MKNMRIGGVLPKNSIESNKSYDDTVKEIADKQDVYTDEYEGYGSLVEMIKNTDKIATKTVDDKTQKE